MPVTINGTTGIAGVDGSASTPAVQGTDTNTGIFFPAADTIAFGEGGTEVMRIDSSGNVGIGTSSAGGLLDSSWGGYDTGQKPALLIGANVGATSTRTNASEKIGVMGAAHYANAEEPVLLISGNVASSAAPITIGGGYAGFNAATAIAFYTAANNTTTTGTERARISSAGEFLVGKTSTAGTAVGTYIDNTGVINTQKSSSANTSTTMEVYSTGASAFRFYVGMGGTIYATSTTITAISDQRLKENIQDIDVGLDAVMALKPRKFDWKEGKGKDKKGDRGWIAQEFEQVFPDMIDTWKDEPPEGEEPYKSVNADLIPVLVKAIQELKAITDAQATRIETLEAQNAAFEARLAALEAK